MKKEFVPAYISGALMNLPLSMMFTFLPAYARQLGATNFQVGLLTTFYFMLSLVASPFWGGLSDLLENRKLFSIGSIMSLSLILFLLSKATLPIHVIILRGCIGFVIPAFSNPILAFISERSSTERRGEDISWYNAFRGIGSMIGLFIIGYLTIFFELSSIFNIFSLSILCTLIPILLLPEKLLHIHLPRLDSIFEEFKSRILPVKEGGESLLKESGLIFLYISIMFRVICRWGFGTFVPVYIVEELGFSLQFLSIFNAVASGVMIFAMLLGGYASDFLGRKRIISLGLFLSSLAPLLYILGGNHMLFLWLGRFSNTFGYSFLRNGSSAFVGDIARKREQGSLMGWINMSWGIGGVIGPILMGIILGSFKYIGSALIMSTFALTGLILTLVKVGETTNPRKRDLPS